MIKRTRKINYSLNPADGVRGLNLYAVIKQEVDLGLLALRRDNADLAVTLFRSALRKLSAGQPFHDHLVHNLLLGYKLLIEQLFEAGRADAAEYYLREALELDICGEMAGDTDFRRRFAGALQDLGLALFSYGRYDECVKCCRKAQTVFRFSSSARRMTNPYRRLFSRPKVPEVFMKYRLKIFVPILASVLFICICGGVRIFAQTSEIEYSGDFNPNSNRAAGKKDQKKETASPLRDRADEESEIKIETSLVINEVLVLDKDRRVVGNLTKEDFMISEDGLPQEIEEFSFGYKEKFSSSIVLIIDHSVSQLPYLLTSIEAAKCLVDKLDPDDRMAILTDNVEWLQAFTGDKKLLIEKLETLKERVLKGKLGKSRQYSALMAALGQVEADENRRLVFIFQTDGDELNLLRGELPEKYSLTEVLDFGFEDVISEAEKKRTVIYTIVPDIKFVELGEEEKLGRAKTHYINSERAFAILRNSEFAGEKLKPTEKMLHLRADQLLRQQSALAKLARSAGGRTFYLEQPAQADTIYAEILADMKYRYVLGYYPANQTRDGKIRRIKTEVRGHPDYIVWSRQSYIIGNDR